MVFGGVERECLQLNEDTLWSGTPRPWDNPDALAVLPDVRKALFAGDYARADRLMQKMQGPFNQAYQPLGNLWLDFDHAGDRTEYISRTLDLDRAVACVAYKVGTVTFEREVFASFPDDVIVVRLTCSEPGGLSFTVRMDSPHPFALTTDGTRGVLSGRCPIQSAPNYLKSENPVIYDDPNGEAMRFTALVEVRHEGGTLTADEGGLRVVGGKQRDSNTLCRDQLQRLGQITGPRGARCPRPCRAKIRRRAGPRFHHLAAGTHRRPPEPVSPGYARLGRRPRNRRPCHRRAYPAVCPNKRSRPRRAAVSVRAVSADCLVAPRHPARQPARHLE